MRTSRPCLTRRSRRTSRNSSAAEIIEVERLRRLAALDQRRPWLRDGCLSTTAWLAERFRMAHGAAAADVRMARALEAIPATREAASSGEISVSAVRVLVSAREADPDEFARSEPLLLDAARVHSIGDLKRAVAFWRSAVEARHVAHSDDDPLRERRRLHVSPTVFGMVRIDGDLDPETGETVLTALRSCVDADARSGDPHDGRSHAQRRRTLWARSAGSGSTRQIDRNRAASAPISPSLCKQGRFEVFPEPLPSSCTSGRYRATSHGSWPVTPRSRES